MASVSSGSEAAALTRDRALGLAAALLVGVNLRPAITSVAALLQDATRAFELSPTAASVLVTLPVIAFGAAAPLGPLLARRVGVRRALLVTMLVLAAALVLRVLGSWALLPGTFAAGAAIMAAGTLLPQHLKSLRASGVWIGLSSMSFGVGAAFAAGLTVPVFHATASVPLALGVWAVPAVVAALSLGLLLWLGRRDAATTAGRRIAFPPGTRGTVALVTAVFALQALLYFAVTSWLPGILAGHGVDAATAGWLLAWCSIAGLVPTLVTPMIARNRAAVRWFGPALGVVMLGAFVWLATGSESYVWIAGVLGAVQSAAFGLSVSLIVSHAADDASAGILSAVSQGLGYAVAGVGSFAIGVVHDLTGGWTWSLGVMSVLAAVLAVVVALAVRRSPVTLHAASARTGARAE